MKLYLQINAAFKSGQADHVYEIFGSLGNTDGIGLQNWVRV